MRSKIRGKWAEFFELFDAFLCPVAATAAIKHDHSEPMYERTITINGEEMNYFTWVQWCGFIILADLPVLAAPAGRSSEGLPIGVQIVSGAFQEKTCIAIGSLLEEFHLKFEPPPSLTGAKSSL